MKEEHPWEKIYRTEGAIFDEPFPRFGEIVQEFRNQGAGTVLDLGCGNGRHTVHLAKAGFEVTGLDISPTGLVLAQRWLKDEGLAGSLVLSDMEWPLPFNDGTFEALLSTQVIHHALKAKVLATIDEIWRVLAPGGIAFLSVAGLIFDNIEYVQVEPRTWIPESGYEIGLPHHIFDRQTLREALGMFRVSYIEYSDDGKVIAALIHKV